MDLEIIPPEHWEKLFPHGEELSQTSVEPAIFLSPFWIGAWWCHFSEERQPCMLAAWEAGRICGLAPFYFRRISLPYQVLSGEHLHSVSWVTRGSDPST